MSSGHDGDWIARKVDEHVCGRPNRSDGHVAVGDRWYCNGCQRTHTVTKLEHGHQRDPIVPPMIVWDIPARLPRKEP